MLQGEKEEQKDSEVQGRNTCRCWHSPSSPKAHSFAEMVVASTSHAGTSSPAPRPHTSRPWGSPGYFQQARRAPSSHHTRVSASPRPPRSRTAPEHTSPPHFGASPPFKVKGFGSLSAAESLVLSHHLYCHSPTVFYGFQRGSEGALPQPRFLRQMLLLRGASEKD